MSGNGVNMKQRNRFKEIGAEFKTKRKLLKLTQFEFSKIFDMSQSRLSKIEHGILEPGALEDRKLTQLMKEYYGKTA